MKKNFVKKLALGLAFTVAVSSVPATNASAAEANPSFKSKTSTTNRKVLEIGQTKKYGTKNTTAWSFARFNVGNDNIAVAKLSKKGKFIKVTGVSAGQTQIRAVFKNYKTKEVYKDALLHIEVKDSVSAIDIVGANDFVTAINTNYVLTTKVEGSTTAKVEWTVDGENATVSEAGVFNATKAGTYNVTASIKDANGVVVVSDTQKITVKTAVLEAVKQTAINKLQLTFAGDISKITKEDIIILRTDLDNQKMYVRKVTAKDNILTVETILDMTDSHKFTVSYKEEAPTLEFVATDGIVKDLKLNTTRIQYNKPTEIKLIATDANGVELEVVSYDVEGNHVDADGTPVSNKYSFNITTHEGYLDHNDALILYEIGNTAEVTATYHTRKYDDNAKELGTVELKETIVAVAQATVDECRKYTLADKNPAEWTDVVENHDLVAEETAKFFMWAFDTEGEEVIAGNPVAYGYTLTSSNEDIFIIQGNTNILYGNKPGVAHVIVKDSYGNVIWTMPVTVKAQAQAKTLTVSSANVSVSNALNVKDSTTVKYEVKDTYNRPVSVDVTKNEVHVECIATTAKGVTPSDVKKDEYFKYDNEEIVFYGTNSDLGSAKIAKGSYTYQITLNKDNANYKRTIVVNVQEPDTNAKGIYKLVINGEVASETVNTTIKLNNDSPKTVSIKIGEFRNGVLNDYVDFTDEFEIIAPNGTYVDATGAAITTNDYEYGTYQKVDSKTINFHAMSIYTENGEANTVAKAATGVYTIRAQHVADVNNDQLHRVTQTIKIVDETSPVTYKVRENVKTSDVATWNATDAAINMYELYIDGNKINYDENDIIDFNTLTTSTNIPTGNNTFKTYVKTITLYATITVDGTSYRVPVKATINNFVEHALTN